MKNSRNMLVFALFSTLIPTATMPMPNITKAAKSAVRAAYKWVKKHPKTCAAFILTTYLATCAGIATCTRPSQDFDLLAAMGVAAAIPFAHAFHCAHHVWQGMQWSF